MAGEASCSHWPFGVTHASSGRGGQTLRCKVLLGGTGTEDEAELHCKPWLPEVSQVDMDF